MLIFGEREFDPGSNWHTYRLEVDGNTVRLLIDGALFLDSLDNRLLATTASGVGLVYDT